MGASPHLPLDGAIFPLIRGEHSQYSKQPVKKLEHFEQKGAYARFCPVGHTSLAEGVELMSRAVLHCRKQKIEKLLIDSRGLTEFRPPEMSEQYNIAERIAADAQSSVAIAHVASPEWMRFGKFGLVVAKNRGLVVMNFSSEAEALKWLLTPPTEPAHESSSRTFESGGLSRAEI